MAISALEKLMKQDPALYKALLLRQAAELNLHEFVKQAWPSIETNPFQDNWHIEVCCNALMEITRGENRFLLVNLPPRCGKTDIISICWPLWTWIQSNKTFTAGNGVRFLCASYGDKLTLENADKMRDLANSQWFQQNWGDRVKMRQDKSLKSAYGIESGGARYSTSIGGTLLGLGGDVIICIPYNGMILSDAGWIKIGYLVEKKLSVKVAGWDGTKIVWQNIELYEKNNFRPLVEVEFRGGKVRCTEDHLIFTGRGYIPARDVAAGDEVYSLDMEAMSGVRTANLNKAKQSAETEILRDPLSQNISEAGEINQEQQKVFSVRGYGLLQQKSFRKKAGECLLQPRLLWKILQRRKEPIMARWQKIKAMQAVWDEIYTAQKWASKICDLLHKTVCRFSKMTKTENMQILQNRIFAGHEKQYMLFKEVCEPTSFGAREGLRERQIRSWNGEKEVSSRMDDCLQSDYQKKGQESLHEMRNDAEETWPNAGCPSHKLREGRYTAEESDNPLSLLSRENARERIAAQSMEKRIVISVKKITHKEEFVYNVRVGPCHNYFVDGILVHNCDDPHNTESVESDKEREASLRGWRELSSTRLNDPQRSSIVVVMQRLHERDVSGTIISGKDYDKWTHLMFPMRHDPDRHCEADPRTEPGELMWPERFGDKEVSMMERELGPYFASGRLQQSPSPEGGGIIKRDYWKLWPPEGEEKMPDGELKRNEFPPMEYVIASTDTAYTEKEENDYNALAILGLFHYRGMPKIMLMHAWKKHLEFRGATLPRNPGETEMEWKKRRKLGWGMLEWTAYECHRFEVDKLIIEGRATGITLAQEMRKIYTNERWATQLIQPKGSKMARVVSIQPLFAEGMIFAPDREWAETAISEFESFPKGAHDDLVDAVTHGIAYLRGSGMALRREEARGIERDKIAYRGSKMEPLYDV